MMHQIKNEIASSFLLAKAWHFYVSIVTARHEAVWVWTIHWDCFVVPPRKDEILY